MVLDRTDVRSSLASYGASTRPTATEFVPCEYVRFYDTQPQETSATANVWYARGQNFVLAYAQVQPGAEFARTAQPDEYVVLLPDRDGAAVEITTGGSTSEVGAYTVSFVPPGDSRVRVTRAGQLVLLFTAAAEDLVRKCSNAASYGHAHPNVAPLTPWPDPVGGFKLRVYSLDAPKDPTRFGTIFRSTNFMVNYGDGSVGPRDTRRMSPHSHDDFEQCSLVLQGEYVHHIRFPWTADLSKWIDDDHTRIGSPSVAIIPPPSIHTSQSTGSGRNQLIDIFSPPRFDLSEKEGWVLNATEYPMPQREAGV
jgi:mannose-6-phosphate isomerase-like protein (cupin superfamily)